MARMTIKDDNDNKDQKNQLDNQQRVKGKFQEIKFYKKCIFPKK